MIIPEGPVSGPLHYDNESRFLDIHTEGPVRLEPDSEDTEIGFTFAIDFRHKVDLAPVVGERCRIRLAIADDASHPIESNWATAIRTRDVCLTGAFIEFTVPQGGPDWEGESWQAHMGQPVRLDDLLSGQSTHHFTIDLAMSPSLVTYEAELATLRKAGQIWTSEFHPARAVLDTLILLKKPRQIVDLGETLYSHLPLNKEWDDLHTTNPPTKAETVLSSFNVDQKRALKLMRSLPDGLAFVPGCPGSGKTHWALSNVALAQSGSHQAQTLYLLDINHTVDDAADRMVRIYKDWGIKRRVIRMYTWSKVTKETKKFAEDALPEVLAGGAGTATTDNVSDTSSDSQPESLDEGVSFDADEDDEEVDFRKTFAHEAVVRKILGRKRDDTKAPTLDEAAWEYYQEHAEDLTDITTQLADYLQPDKDGNKKAELSRAIVTPLYRMYKHVLREADFLATTPFAAQAYLQFLRPELIVFDEAGHAREVSSLMALVYFRPKAWIFVGDYRQIRPYIAHQDKKENSHPLLFCISAMERLAMNKLAHDGLLQNHRAYANLHWLPSNLFYGRKMTADDNKSFPKPVEKLRNFLDWKRGARSVVPRLVVDIVDGLHELKGTSSLNRYSQEWVADCIAELLDQNLPERIDMAGGQGSILIVSPYKASVDAYEALINERFPEATNIMVRTLNTTQGLEADLVIVDLVRGTKFVQDPRRLCVALTRARQAEIIMVSMRSMRRYPLLRDLWDMSKEVGQAPSIKSPAAIQAFYSQFEAEAWL